MSERLTVYTIDLADATPESLSFGDIIDASEASGVDPEAMQALIADGATGKGAARMRLLCAFAWVIARRADPALRYADVLAGRVEITGQRDQPRPARRRAERGR